jgi:hypothetical protein
VVTDLADTSPGQDLWRYDYTVSGRTFLQSEFFDIFFSSTLYATLTSPTGPSADWDVAILQQPTPGNLPPFDRGMFDAFALTANPSLSGVFSVNFVYLGGGTPGSQPFVIFDASANIVESGVTSVAGTTVPEPSMSIPFSFGLIAWAIYFRRKSAVRT